MTKHTIQKEKEAHEEQFRQKYFQLQMLLQQMKQAKEQQGAFDQQISELEQVKNSLDELNAASPGTELLVPVSGGIFAKASLLDNKEVIVNVGAGVAVPKPIEASAKLVSNQMDEVRQYRDKLHDQIEAVQKKTKELEAEFRSIMKDKEATEEGGRG